MLSDLIGVKNMEQYRLNTASLIGKYYSHDHTCSRGHGVLTLCALTHTLMIGGVGKRLTYRFPK